jgi:HlyD family secretion protein
VVLYPVSVQLEAAGVPVRAGMTADVEIVTASVGDVLIVPLRAVQGTEGDYHVLRQVEEGARRSVAGFEMVPVTLGARTETEVVIAAGLSEGDVVSVVAVPAPTGGQGGFGPMRFVGGGGR